MSLAARQLREGLGFSHSPEVPTEILAADARLMVGMQVGHRLNRHVFHYALEQGYKALGDAVDQPAIKDWAPALSRITTFGVSTLLLLFLPPEWGRILTFGVNFESIEGMLDLLVEALAGGSE